jgi:hypothetical protein
MRAHLALIVLAMCAPAFADAQAAPPAYRARILGVYTTDGDPIEGAEVSDQLSKTSALTTKTGTITLSFLPEGATLLRIRKVGFTAATMLVNIDPADTLPVTVMLKASVRELPTVVTRDSAPRYLSPGLREFENRRARGNGIFVTEAELRKNDTKMMTTIARNISGLKVVCARNGGTCIAASARQGSKFALRGGMCPADVYMDGVPSTDNNLERMRVQEFAAVEYYAGGARTPVEYNKTGSSCGVLLLWTRER